MEKKFNFVYITTNLINGKQYVGEHSTNDMECFRTKKYLGGGKLIGFKVKQYGAENFKREILEYFETKQEAFDAQEKYIKLYKTHVSQGGYNKDWTGGSGWISEETRQKLKLAALHCSPETKEKLSIAGKNRIIKFHEDGRKRKYNGRKYKGRKSVPLPLETRQKISNTLKNQIISKETREKMSLSKKIMWAKKRAGLETTPTPPSPTTL